MAFCGAFVIAFLIAFPCTIAGQGDKYEGRHLKVRTLISSSFVKQAEDGTFIGMIPDLLKVISEKVGFTYTWELQPDGRTGSMQEDGTFNGLVGSLTKGEADLVASDLSITSRREMAVDFTVPWIENQFRILINTDTGRNCDYLVLNSGSKFNLLRTTSRPELVPIWQNIQAKNGFVNSVEEGIAKVRQGGYCYVEDTITFVPVLGGKLAMDPMVIMGSFYAFAVPAGSDLEEPISVAILQCAEEGVIQNLLNKWEIKYQVPTTCESKAQKAV